MQVLRGSQSIYNAYLFEQPNTPPLRVVERKGRSERLKNLQNELIVSRYYYYIKIIRKNYPDTLEALETEMFLAPLTITRIIQANHALMKSMAKDCPGVAHFKKKYPWLVW